MGKAMSTWLLVLLGVALASAAAGEDVSATGLMRMEAEGRPKRDCWIYVPKTYDGSKLYPLVVVLHPAGLRGSLFVRSWGEVAERTGAFIVAGPECKDPRTRTWEFSDEPEFIATVKKVSKMFSIDPGRVLLTGFSQGGVYTYIFGLRNPTVFRAIAPLSGALIARPGPESEAILLRARAEGVYIAHGALDDRIPVERARASRDRLLQAGFSVTYREVPQLGHSFQPGEPERIWAWFTALTSQPQPVGKKTEEPKKKE